MSEDSSIQVLLKHNVTVGVGVIESWNARNARFDIGWVSTSKPNINYVVLILISYTQLALDAGGSITKAQAMAIGSTNVEKLLGGKVEVTAEVADLVATEGGDLFDFTSKVKAVISPRRGFVNLL